MLKILQYCYILKVYPRHYPRKVLSPELRVEIQKMDEISKQTELLIKHKIKTYDELLFYKDNLVADIEKLVARRNYLWNKVRATNEEKDKRVIRSEISNITNEIEEKKKGVILCDGIEKRTGVLEKNIEEFEQTKGKEKEIK